MSLEALQAMAIAVRQRVEAEVGLNDPEAEKRALRLQKKIAETKAATKKRRRDDAQAVVAAGLVRRSSRLGDKPAIDFNEDNIFNALADGDKGVFGGGRRGSSGGRGGGGGGGGEGDDAEDDSAAPRPVVKSAASAAAPDSSRGLPARMDWMTAHFLGRFIPSSWGGAGNQAKRAVMNSVCGRGPRGNGKMVAFNKYAGVQPFSNAIVLFVNMFSDSEEGGNGAASFVNEFLEGGKRITWFASDKMHATHPTVLQLVHHAKGKKIPLGDAGAAAEAEESSSSSSGGKQGPAAAGAASSSSSSSSSSSAAVGEDDDDDNFLVIRAAPVGLAVRLAPTLPYVWCGELEYHTHSPRSRPIRFEWRLKHFDELKREVDALPKMKKGREQEEEEDEDDEEEEDDDDGKRGAAASSSSSSGAGARRGLTKFGRVLRAGGIK